MVVYSVILLTLVHFQHAASAHGPGVGPPDLGAAHAHLPDAVIPPSSAPALGFNHAAVPPIHDVATHAASAQALNPRPAGPDLPGAAAASPRSPCRRPRLDPPGAVLLSALDAVAHCAHLDLSHLNVTGIEQDAFISMPRLRSLHLG